MMSYRQERVTCSSCKNSQTITIYPHIDVEAMPHLKQQVLNRTLFSPSCTFCHQPLEIIYPCIYHDQQEKLLVYLAPFYQPGDEKTLKYDLFEDIEESVTYHLRVVTDFVSLSECLQLFYHRLDDRVYHIAKEVIAAEIQSQIVPHQIISGRIELNQDNQLCFCYQDDQQQHYDIAIDHDIVKIIEETYADRWLESHDFELIDFVWARQMIEVFENE